MDKQGSKRFLLTLAAAYWALAALVYFVAGEQFHRLTVTSDALAPSAAVGEIVDGMELRQRVTLIADSVQSVDVMAATYGRANAGEMRLRLVDQDGETAATARCDVSALKESEYVRLPLDRPIEGRKGETLTLEIDTQGCLPGASVALYTGNQATTGRFDIVQNIAEEDRYTLDGEMGVGKLCVKLSGVDTLVFYRVYWVIVTAAFALAAALCLYWWRRAMRGENNPLVSVCTLRTRYSFLLRQLVSRDFKAKYKRSALGMIWSFLNPLLTMSVQYVVFSTLFRSSTPNYAVYLLTGIVFFNFFNEAAAMGMTSITGNASLIKKVYMPKYIYPVARLISSLINFGLSLVPLLIVMLLSGIAPRPSLLLLVFDVLCLMGFVMGMVLLLTTAMTFFQDTQFLWGVMSMMWMYMTPIFYTESIIPQKLLTVFHMNPMYQYITFARICVVDGVSPAPTAYLWCVASSLAVLLLGIAAFKRHQDKFVLYL